MKIKLQIVLVLILFASIANTGFAQQNAKSKLILQKEVNAYNKQNNNEQELKTRLQLIKVLLDEPDYSSAKNQLDTCNQIALKVSKPLYMQYLSSLGDYYRYTGNNEDAFRTYLNVYDFFQKNNNPNLYFKSAVDLLEQYRKSRNYKLANEFIKVPSNILRTYKISDTSTIIRFYGRVAAIKNESVGSDSAIFYTNLALKFARQQKNEYAIATAYNELGFALIKLNKFDTAYKCYQFAEDTWFRLNANREAMNAFYNKLEFVSHSSSDKGLRKKNILLYYELLEKIKKKNLDSDFLLSRIYENMASEYFFIGDSLNGYKYTATASLKKYRELSKENEAKIAAISKKYDTEKIKLQMKAVEEKLNSSKKIIEKDKKEKKLIFILFSVCVAFLMIVAYFLFVQNRANKLLKKRNREKDVLLQEVHHRVKNNLQFISGLLEMHQNKDIENSLIHDASRRVSAMALVHEMLYNNDLEQKIDLKKYIEELAKYHFEDTFKINYQLSILPLTLNTTQCISLGMIISELITNSIKHAFNSISNPTINLTIHCLDQNKVVFIYSDNGNGFIKNDSDFSNSLGLRLIDIFTRQLKGKYSINGSNGYEFNLNFKIKNEIPNN